MAKKFKIIKKFIGNIFVLLWVGYIAMACIMALGAIITGTGSLLIDDIGTEQLADGFTISAYNVLLDVKKDNKVDVTENITVDWYESYHHGIYKFTPLWLQYTGQDGNTIKRKSIVSNYRAVGEPYSLDTVKRKARIKIGSADKYVGEGKKTYVIKYTYDMGKDPYKGFDELIFHAYGDYWGTEIKNASIQVNMPKSIDGCDIKFFTDKFRKNDVTDVVDYSVDGNTLFATFNEEKNYQKQLKDYLSEEWRQNEDGTWDEEDFDSYYYKPLEQSLTLDIELPEGYFVGGSWNYGWGSFIISMVIFVLTVWTICKWIKYGKDHPKKAQTVEFYPPDDLSSAEIGYVFNKKQASKKFTIALIIQLASKGYIKIDDLKDKDNNIQITNLLIKPKKIKDFDKTLPKRQIKVKKLKDADSNLNKAENTMMIYLFKKGDTKLLETNINKFLDVKDKLVNGGYIEIINDNEDERLKDIEKKKAVYDKEVEQYNRDMEKYKSEASKFPALSSMEKIVYDRLFESENVIILSEHHTFYKAFDDVASKLKSSFKDKVYDRKASKQVVGAVLRSIVILILSIVSYGYVEDLDPNWNILYYLAFMCNFINLFFTIFMKRKTEYGEYITARVNGFRHFLVTAEKQRLEALVAENPNYFYNILPYTYAMNISKKWIKKFENIPVPEKDMGTFNYGSDYSYYSLYDNVYYPEPVYSSTNSGCSSCGGGCSSCGGGCSSCGGGGSW